MQNNTVVCNCLNVTKQDLIDAITNGAKSFEEVQEVTKVSKGCGACNDVAKAIVEELMA